MEICPNSPADNLFEGIQFSIQNRSKARERMFLGDTHCAGKQSRAGIMWHGLRPVDRGAIFIVTSILIDSSKLRRSGM